MMRRAVRSVAFPLNCLTRRFPLKRMHTIGSDVSQRFYRGQNTTLLLAGTALLSATSGYLLATYECQRSKGVEEVCAPGSDHQRYGSANDFRKAIEELKATFPTPGAVSDDPEVLMPYGFSENDYHPGSCFFAVYIEPR
jgi:hypothetical protein